MAKWKKGDPSPNPKGRPKLPEDVKELKTLNRVELERRLNEFMQLTPAQLKRVKDNPESITLELLIASVITQAVNKGDHTRFDFLLNQLIGKRPETLNIKSENTTVTATATISEMVKNPQILKDLIQIERRFRETRDS